MTQEVLQILEILNTAGREAYLVGGSVRDFCLGKTPKDYDITTSALPEETMQCFQDAGYSVIPTG
ncbi:MAG: [Clostridia bacterium]|nr:[cytidine(C)-cytidine(C)-adenosine (A)]-adding enzyme [Clostridia bacterium]